MGVQYLTNEDGERVSVVLPVEEYERLQEIEEKLEDVLARRTYDRAVEELEHGGRRGHLSGAGSARDP